MCLGQSGTQKGRVATVMGAGEVRERDGKGSEGEEEAREVRREGKNWKRGREGLGGGRKAMEMLRRKRCWRC
ncbi:hypothetical protein MRB53_042269 [Persea americana]|nr:hypothetical protein MRB53_042269 [Persea americana]